MFGLHLTCEGCSPSPPLSVSRNAVPSSSPESHTQASTNLSYFSHLQFAPCPPERMPVAVPSSAVALEVPRHPRSDDYKSITIPGRMVDPSKMSELLNRRFGSGGYEVRVRSRSLLVCHIGVALAHRTTPGLIQMSGRCAEISITLKHRETCLRGK